MMLGGYARFKERNMVRSETLSAQGKQCVFRVFLPHQCRDQLLDVIVKTSPH